MKLSEIKNKTRKVEVSFQGESIEIEFRANVVTPAFLSDKPDVQEQLRRAVVHWNIIDDNGKEVPVKDAVDSLPVDLLALMINAITEDIRLASAEKNV